MEFIPPTLVHRVLCADCGELLTIHFWMLASDRSVRNTNRTEFCKSMRTMSQEYVRVHPRYDWLFSNLWIDSVDVTEGIPKSGNYVSHVILDTELTRSLASVSFCRNCDRFLSPPTTWTIAEPESRELLAICLKKLKGLNKVRLVDAGFIWTEPHSKRLRVKLTIQKEVSKHPIPSEKKD
jgi:hypothetical protein